ncbi:helix-turn-helix domain-containing protein [Heyndrickxia oleronia]|jgi:DNA-binding transcriptional regulator YiaG|uniref:helix-turn-helix domain-containing protein n=2 Tax=Heyndrickxia oleronia TaxID=38875 RepID=UPI00242F26F4|nr:helix-turn-helix transcriptional regulator [Heyndrickxia oleronia]MCI1763136.1 helix-turn-helix domain-containing protein [Heyndrickxia oleronia]
MEEVTNMTTTFNITALKLINEIKTNMDYIDIKKEALINFGFDPLKLEDLTEWIIFNYDAEVEEILGSKVSNDREYTDIEIELLSQNELDELGYVSSENDNDNEVVGYLIANGKTVPVDVKKKERKERYTLLNKKEWFESGQVLKQQRLELGVSLAKMGQLLNTSTSRIANLENGKPVMMHDNLIASYKLVLELEKMKQDQAKQVEQKNTQINHIQIVHDGGDLYILNLITESGTKIHIEDIHELKWAHMIAKNKFAKYLNVPIILKLENGEKVRLDVEHSQC